MNLEFFYNIYEKAKKEIENDPKIKDLGDKFLSLMDSLVPKILSKKELEYDMECLLSEQRSCGNAWGQMPAVSYGNNLDGHHNLKNMVNLMAEKINNRQQTKFPEMLVCKDIIAVTCTNCSTEWFIKKFDKSNCSITCPSCAYLGPLTSI